MIKYFTESEDSFDDIINPVDEAKKNPETIPVGAACNEAGEVEFYMSAADVAKYAELNEESILDALNDIICCNEEADMTADNIVLIMDESTACFARTLEQNGAAYVFMNEAGVDDISVDVQVGPGKDEETVTADPQEANPVDAVKRGYDSVVVAKNDDQFFMDVEDVQKCAELNCESVIDTLNSIIDVHEEFGMNADNLHIIVNENTSEDLIQFMREAGVRLCVVE